MAVTLLDLWLPILLSAIAVFFLSFLMWMVLPHHRSDYGPLPDEEGTIAHLGNIPRGQYMFPHCTSPEAMKDPAWMKQWETGPTGILTIAPRGPMNIGKSMFTSFLYNLALSTVVAYLATIGLTAATSATDVFRMTATTAFLGCGGALGWQVIWHFSSAKVMLKSLGDALIYGIATGFLFMQFWPA